MKLPDNPVTLEEFHKAINEFIKGECEMGGDHPTHKKCGSGIRVGFVNLFYVNEDGSLEPGGDGFGIGPHRVPYCEKCDPPDGFNYTYARRLGIKRPQNEKPPKKEELTWDDIEWYLGKGRYSQ